MLGHAPLGLRGCDVAAIRVEIAACLRGVDHPEAARLEQPPRGGRPRLLQGPRHARSECQLRAPVHVLGCAQRDLEDRADALGQRQEPDELEIFLTVRRSAQSQRRIARPAHDGRERLAMRLSGLPLGEDDRLARGPPAPRSRRQSRVPRLREREVEVMGADAAAKGSITSRNLGLVKAGSLST